MGGPDAVAAVRKALQLGAHHALHVSDEAIAGSDVFGTATRARGRDPEGRRSEAPLDLVITGMAALDGLTSMLPTALAAELDGAADPGVVTVRVRTAWRRSAAPARFPRDGHGTPALRRVRHGRGEQAALSQLQAHHGRTHAPVTAWTLGDLGVGPERRRGAARTSVWMPPSARRARTAELTDTGEGGTRLAEFLIERGLA